MFHYNVSTSISSSVERFSRGDLGPLRRGLLFVYADDVTGREEDWLEVL